MIKDSNAQSEESLPVLLKKVGFVELSDEVSANVRLWKLSKHLAREDFSFAAFTCDELYLQVEGNHWSIQSLVVNLDINIIQSEIESSLKDSFRNIRNLEWFQSSECSYWLVIEFADQVSEVELFEAFYQSTSYQNSGLVKHGSAGIHIHMIPRQSLVSVCLSEYFFIGDTPHQLFTVLRERILNLIGKHAVSKVETTHERSFDPILVLISSCPALGVLSSHYKPTALAQTELAIANESITIKVDLDAVSDFLRPLPVEVLEDRELESSTDTSYEKRLLQLNELEVTRRKDVLTCIARNNPPSSRNITSLLNNYPEDMLYLSVGGRFLNSHDEAIKNLSKLATLIEKKVRDVDSIKSLQVVLPEVLGDLWMSHEPAMALHCYYELLKREQAAPRHYQKVAFACHQLGNTPNEIEALEDLAKAVSFKPLLGKIYYQLSQISLQEDNSKARAYLQQSLNYDKENLNYAMEFAQLLRQNHQGLQAINALDVTIERVANSSLIPNAQMLIAHLLIAEIWAKDLNRLDLSLHRLLQIPCVTLPDQQFQDHYFAILSQAKSAEANKAIFERILFDLTHGVQDVQKVSGLDHNVSTAYQSNHGVLIANHNLSQNLLDWAEAILPKTDQLLQDLYYEFSAFTWFSTSKIAQLLADGVNLNWKAVYQNCSESLNQITTASPQAEPQIWSLHQTMAMIALEKLHDNALAMQHFVYLANSHEATLDLVLQTAELLEDSKREDDAYALLRNRLNADNTPETESLILNILKFSHKLTRQDFQQLNLRLWQIDRQYIDHVLNVIKEEFQTKSQDSNAQILSFVKQVLNYAPQLSDQLHFLSKLLGYLESQDLEKSHNLIHEIYLLLMELSSDHKAIAQRAIRCFRNHTHLESLFPFVKILINQGVLPEIPTSDLLGLLNDHNHELAIAHELISQTLEQTEDQIHHLRQSLSFLGHVPTENPKPLQLLLLIGQRVALSPPELDQLILLVRVKGLWSQLGEVLAFQWGLKLETTTRIKLSKAILTNRNLLKLDLEIILSSFDCLIEHESDKSSLRIERAFFVLDFPYEERYETFLRVCIDEDRLWRHVERMLRFFDAMASRGLLDSNKLDRILQKLRVVASWDISLFNQYISGLQDFDWIRRSLPKLQFDVFLERGDLGEREELKRIWRIELGKLKTPKDINEFWSGFVTSFELPKMHELLEDLVHNNDVLSNPELARELDVLYAVHIFSMNLPMKAGIERLIGYFVSHQDDDRIWMPIYFYYKDHGSEKQQFEFLSAIINKVKKRPRVLKNLPITIESLQREFEDMGRRQNLPVAPHSPQSESIAPAAPFSLSINLNDSHGDSLRESIPEKNVPEDLVGATIKFFETSSTQIDLPLILEPPKASASLPSNSDVQLPVKHDEPKELPSQTHSGYDKTMIDDIVGNWRQTVQTLGYSKGMTSKVFDWPFENILEKHLAVQAFALLSGEISILNKWEMKVWRSPDHDFYPIVNVKRLNHESSHNLLGGNLHKLLELLIPVMLKYFERHFSLEHIARQAKIDKLEIIDKRTPVLWDNEYFVRLGFLRFKKALYDEKFVCFSLTGLGSKLYYDYRYKAIYFDGGYYRDQPPSIAFHRILLIIRSIQQGFYPLLKLNPQKHILAMIEEIRKLLPSSLRSGIKLGIKGLMPALPESLESFLKEVDQTRLASLLARCDDCDLDTIKKLQSTMWDQLYKTQLSETLDLVGLCEAVTGMDIIQAGDRDHLEIIQLSRYISALLQLTSTLDIE